MASEIERIQDQLKRAFEGDAWHGPSMLELISELSADEATARPIAGAHNIWELVLHIAAWDKAVARRLGGDRAELSEDENWPRVNDDSETAWQQTLESLKRNHHELRMAVADLDDTKLDEPIVAGMSSVYATLHGVIQHDLYHAGQIAILKKALTPPLLAA
jgi:uncharacterized damage-inducible protein DinB